jgi:hypothetical protein
VIVAAEKELGTQHLISLNIANGKAKVENVHAAVSILNFHYAWPPETVAMNYGLGRVLGDNETGFKGTEDFRYRREAWAFILAGGGLYNNLDYSFAVGYEDGTFSHPDQPGGGSAALRVQLGVLSTFIHGLDFIHMSPGATPGGLPDGFSAYALGERGIQYAVYVCGAEKEPPEEDLTAELELELSAGTYRAEWLDTLTGVMGEPALLIHDGGTCVLTSPTFREDTALRVTAANG